MTTKKRPSHQKKKAAKKRVTKKKVAPDKTGRKQGRGRPSDYRPEYATQAERACELFGATDAELATFFGVNERTVNRWKAAQPDFCQALKKGKAQSDRVIADSLFHRARGYTHAEEKVFNNNGEIVRANTTRHYPPDVTACIFWLKNRQPRQWRQRDVPVNVELKGSLTEQGESVMQAIGAGEITPAEGSSILAALASQARIVEIDELEQRVQRLEERST